MAIPVCTGLTWNEPEGLAPKNARLAGGDMVNDLLLGYQADWCDFAR